MKNSEAAQILRNIMITLQRFRSIVNEEIAPPGSPAFTKELLEDLQPWIFGEKCPIPSLSRVLDDYEESGKIDPMFLYNMVYVANHLEPSIYAACTMLGYYIPKEPNLYWMRGFEEG